MKSIRKFIIKFGFGRYWYKLWFQKNYNYTSRFGFNFFNLLLLSAILGLILNVMWISFLVFFTGAFISIIYFRYWPVQFEELDDEQKWFYVGTILGNPLVFKDIKLTYSQIEEYHMIKKIMKKKYNLK